jgi:hypothetical protein
MNNDNTQNSNRRQSNFNFIDDEIKQIKEFAVKAELRGKLDTRYACFQAPLKTGKCLKNHLLKSAPTSLVAITLVWKCSSEV